MRLPYLGLAPQVMLEIFSVIRKLHGQGVTILLVEQNAKMALQTADRAYVLESGQVSFTSNASDLLTDERIRQAYLG